MPNVAAERAAVLAAVRKRLASLESRYPGLAAEEAGAELHVIVPDKYRVGHEAHFAQVITTEGVELSRKSP
jgi:hypothetical protein